MIICLLYIKLFNYQDTGRPHQLQDLQFQYQSAKILEKGTQKGY